MALTQTAETESDEKHTKATGRLGNALSSVLLAITSVALAAIVVLYALGGSTMSVLTGSMNPNIPPGTFLINERVDPNQLKVGDVIAYMPQTPTPGGLSITHRVISLDKSNTSEVTSLVVRGDANPSADAPLSPSQVTGRTLLAVPYLGLPNVWLFEAGLPNLQVLAIVAVVLYGCYALIRKIVGMFKRS